MSTSTRVIKNTGYLYAKMAITMFISLWITRLILGSLGSSDYGIYSVVGGAIAMLGFLNNTMATATQRFINYAEGEGNAEKVKDIFNASIVLHLAVALLVGVLLEIAYYFFFDGILNIPAERVGAAKFIYHCAVASTMFTIMTVPYNAVINAHENMLYFAVVGVFDSLMKLGIAFWVVNSRQDKLRVYGLLMALESVVLMLIMRFYCKRHYEECRTLSRRYVKKGVVKDMTAFASWSFFNCTTSMIAFYGQGIILNSFFGTVLNAAQGIVSQLKGQLSLLSTNMMKALNPVLGKSAGAHDKQLMERSAIAGAKFSALLFCVVAIPLYGVLPYALKLWLKNVPEWTLIFLKLQLLQTLFEMLTSTLSSSIKANGNISGYSTTSSIVYLLQLPAIYIAFKLGLPPYMMYVVGIVVSGVLLPAIFLHYVRKFSLFSVKEYLRKSVLPVLTIVLVFVLCEELAGKLFTVDTPLGLCLYIALAFVAFTVAVCLFLLTRDEREQLWIMVQRVLRKTH